MALERNSVLVRPATQAHVGELARLFELFEAQTASPTQIEKRLNATQDLETALLAEQRGQIVGLACLRVIPALFGNGPHAELSEFYVEKAYQGQGVERALLTQAVALARHQGAQQLALHTGLQNHAAQSIYRSLGFLEFALAMRKILRV